VEFTALRARKLFTRSHEVTNFDTPTGWNWKRALRGIV